MVILIPNNSFYHRGAFGDPHDENNYFHLEPLDLENGSVCSVMVIL